MTSQRLHKELSKMNTHCGGKYCCKTSINTQLSSSLQLVLILNLVTIHYVIRHITILSHIAWSYQDGIYMGLALSACVQF